MKKGILYFIFLTIFSFYESTAQTKFIDSLKHQLSIATEDSIKVELLCKICSEMAYEKPEKAFTYGFKAYS